MLESEQKNILGNNAKFFKNMLVSELYIQYWKEHLTRKTQRAPYFECAQELCGKFTEHLIWQPRRAPLFVNANITLQNIPTISI